jgi:hypothetical protein
MEVAAATAVGMAAEKAVEAKNLHRRPRLRSIQEKFHF